MTQAQAIQITDSILKDMTPAQVREVVQNSDESLFDTLRMYAWNTGVGGWYYDNSCTLFCVDKVICHLLNIYLEVIK
jgi:hypothetical protein